MFSMQCPKCATLIDDIPSERLGKISPCPSCRSLITLEATSKPHLSKRGFVAPIALSVFVVSMLIFGIYAFTERRGAATNQSSAPHESLNPKTDESTLAKSDEKSGWILFRCDVVDRSGNAIGFIAPPSAVNVAEDGDEENDRLRLVDGPIREENGLASIEKPNFEDGLFIRAEAFTTDPPRYWYR